MKYTKLSLALLLTGVLAILTTDDAFGHNNTTTLTIEFLVGGVLKNPVNDGDIVQIRAKANAAGAAAVGANPAHPSGPVEGLNLTIQRLEDAWNQPQVCSQEGMPGIAWVAFASGNTDGFGGHVLISL